MSMPIDLITVNWFDDIAMADEVVTVSDGNLNPIEQTWSIPQPTGNPVPPVYYCDRILTCYCKGSSTFAVVQAGEGENVRFAVVPQSAIGSPRQKA